MDARSDVTCPFCGETTVRFVRQDLETRFVESNMSLDNVARLLSGEPMVPAENRHVEGRVAVGSTLTVTHFDGTVHTGKTPSDWKWPE